MHRLCVQIKGEPKPDWPIPIEYFLASGQYGGDFVGVLHYDEVYLCIHNLSVLLTRLVPEDAVSTDMKDDEIIMVPMKAKDLRLAKDILKGVPPTPPPKTPPPPI